MKVVAICRKKERLEKLQAAVAAQDLALGSFLPVVCDVTKEAEVVALPKIVARHWTGSGIDVLVNCAGVSRKDASLIDGNTAAWVEIVSTNILGTCLCTREVIKVSKHFQVVHSACGAWLTVLRHGHEVPHLHGSLCTVRR